MPITDADLARIKAEHPDHELHLLSNAEMGVEVVVKAPGHAEWKVFRTSQSDDLKKPTALRDLLLCCIVEPPAQAFMAVLGHRPGLAETFGAELLEIGGLSRDTIRRKL